MRRPRLLLIVALLLAACGGPARPRHTYVIVHGAWGGGWDWRAVDSMLTLRGHRVERVTLTGLGERSHLAARDIGLATHIDDVVNTILWDELQDVVLVGHSYGGAVITGAVDRIPGRIRRAVYIDAFLPDSGETAITLGDSAASAFVRSSVRDGFSIPGWVRDTTVIPRDVPHPYRTLTDTLRLVNAARMQVPGTYILTFEPGAEPDQFQRHADRAAERGWPVHRLQANHVPERSAREPLVQLLADVP